MFSVDVLLFKESICRTGEELDCSLDEAKSANSLCLRNDSNQLTRFALSIYTFTIFMFNLQEMFWPNSN